MQFKDAGKTYPGLAMESDKPSKSYPRFTIDLDQFPGLEADVDEEIEITLRSRVSGITHTDYCHTMDLEVRSIAQPGDARPSKIALVSAADQELEKLKGRSL